MTKVAEIVRLREENERLRSQVDNVYFKAWQESQTRYCALELVARRIMREGWWFGTTEALKVVLSEPAREGGAKHD